jgi:hypothetical protein
LGSLPAQAARDARAKHPNAEYPLLALMAALNSSRQPREAVKEADLYIKDHAPSSTVLAQRGYSRRATGDLRGAIEDFSAALAQPGVEPQQKKGLSSRLPKRSAQASRAAGLLLRRRLWYRRLTAVMTR